MTGILLTLFFGTIAAITAYFKFAVKLTILPSERSLDASNPFSTPFILKNESLLWITNVKPHQVISYNINDHSMKLNTNLVAPAILFLSSGEPTTFSLPISEIVFPERIFYLNIVIGVSYCPAFMPFYKKEKKFRFVTIKDKNNRLYWTSKALSE